MTLLSEFRRDKDAESTEDEALYLQVLHELESGYRRDGLWAKALVEAEGNADAATAKYMRLRVLSIKQDSSEKAKAARLAEKTARTVAKREKRTKLVASVVETIFLAGCGIALVLFVYLAVAWMHVLF